MPLASGGMAGRKGENIVLRSNGQIENIGGKAQTHMAAGVSRRLYWKLP